MKIMSREIIASRWPWQQHATDRRAFLNLNGARFGGGWIFKLGIAIGEGGTVMLELGWGIITIRKALKR